MKFSADSAYKDKDVVGLYFEKMFHKSTHFEYCIIYTMAHVFVAFYLWPVLTEVFPTDIIQ